MGQTAEQAQHRASEAADQIKAQAQVNTYYQMEAFFHVVWVDSVSMAMGEGCCEVLSC
jgi:hypothetical protein